ncbi:hypothetical protein STPH1_4233 [Streptomyces sp. OM5714]|nr:hypothetical protein STPH1_4233 [Streptomyces sp. OM5714]
MEALDYIIAVRRWRKLPWKVEASSLRTNNQQFSTSPEAVPELPPPGLLAYCIAGILRISVGGGVTAAVTVTSPDAISAWLAVLIGATSPLVLEKITIFVPLVVQVGKEGIAAHIQQSQQAPQASNPPSPASPPTPSPAVNAAQDGSTSGQGGI